MPLNLKTRDWLVVALSVVVSARAVLLVFQLHDEHHPKPGPPPTSWPAHAGEELRFGQAVLPELRRWSSSPDHAPLAAGLLEKNFELTAPDTGCLLDPMAMAQRGGGTLTLRNRDAQGYWLADWNGTATMLSPADLPAAAATGSSAKQREVQAAMVMAADCGGSARLTLGENTVHILINALNGRPAPPLDPHRPRRRLIIPVDGPPPL